MGSKGRLPPPHHLRRPLPGPGMGHHDPMPPEMHPHHGGFPPYDMPPHPEIMEQKLAAQHVEMQKLATENRRFAATHGTLRQDLATIQHELQMLHNHIGGVKSEREQQIMGLLERNGKMEADLQGAEPLKMELNKARVDAQGLLAAREELVSRVQQLTEDHQRVHMDLQQIPALMAELENLRQEYQHSRQTHEYEKKLYNEHLESLQVMEKNYMTMASEVEKLRAELKKQAEIDRRTAAAAAAGPYAGFAGHNEKEASGHYPVGQKTFEDAYVVSQGRGPLPGSGAAADGNTAVGAQSGPTALRAGYDAYRGPGPAVPGYDVQRGPGFHKGSGAPAYDPQRGPGAPAYDPQRGPGAPAYDPQRGPNPHGYDPHRGAGYDLYRGPGGTGYDRQRGPGGPVRGPQFGGPGYEAHRGTSFESPTAPSGPQGQATQQATYGSVAAIAHAGSGFQGAQVHPPPTQADGRR